MWFYDAFCMYVSKQNSHVEYQKCLPFDMVLENHMKLSLQIERKHTTGQAVLLSIFYITNPIIQFRSGPSTNMLCLHPFIHSFIVCVRVRLCFIQRSNMYGMVGRV